MIGTLAVVLSIARDAYGAFVGHALEAYPLESCGLLAGPIGSDGAPGRQALRYYPCRNDAASARVYLVNPQDFMRAEIDADDRGWEICGVVHSHTHTEPYPSPTDIGAAVSDRWHSVIVSLKREAPETRSYRIAAGSVRSEPLTIA